MEKNKKNTKNNDTVSNYELKSDAVDALVNADSEEVPQYSEEELSKYRSKSKFHIPETVKVLFIKGWFAGAVCYFFLWGLGTYISSMIDMLFILGVVLGMVTDLLTNNVIRFIEKTPGANDKWLMFSPKKFMSFFLNMIYAFLIIFCVYQLYVFINGAITAITGNADSVPLGVEPVLFGVFSMAFDVLFVGIRNTFLKIVREAKESARSQGKQDQADTK